MIRRPHMELQSMCMYSISNPILPPPTIKEANQNRILVKIKRNHLFVRLIISFVVNGKMKNIAKLKR